MLRRPFAHQWRCSSYRRSAAQSHQYPIAAARSIRRGSEASYVRIISISLPSHLRGKKTRQDGPCTHGRHGARRPPSRTWWVVQNESGRLRENGASHNSTNKQRGCRYRSRRDGSRLEPRRIHPPSHFPTSFINGPPNCRSRCASANPPSRHELRSDRTRRGHRHSHLSPPCSGLIIDDCQTHP